MFSFGSDPEVFVSNNGNLKSAIRLLPSKEKRKTINGASVYYDNVLAEIQVKPSYSRMDAVDNFRDAIDILNEELRENEIRVESSNWFPDSELTEREARIAGCNPEYCVYTLEQVLPPQDIIETTGFRTAGGHIHIGDNELLNDGMEMLNVIRMMDLFIGLPSVLLDHDATQVFRRNVYGHAGSHRIPEHGLEYRCLGNFWVKSPKLLELVYDLTKFTIDFVEDGGHKKFWAVDESLLDGDDVSAAHSCFGYDIDLLRKCINSCDRKKASNFMHMVECYLPNSLISQIYEMQDKKFDFYKEWNIKCSVS